MCQVIQFPVIPRKAADRVGQKKFHLGMPYWRTRYRCPDCGIEKTLCHGALYVAPIQICDSWGGCGAEMRPVEMEAR